MLDSSNCHMALRTELAKSGFAWAVGIYRSFIPPIPRTDRSGEDREWLGCQLATGAGGRQGGCVMAPEMGSAPQLAGCEARDIVKEGSDFSKMLSKKHGGYKVNARAMTPAEIASAVGWYSEAVAYFSRKPWSRTPPAISAGPRRIAFPWCGGIAILTMRAGWQLRDLASHAKRSPIEAVDVIDAVEVTA